MNPPALLLGTLLLVAFRAFGQEPPPQAPQVFQEKPPIYLILGEQRMLNVPGLLRFSLGEASVRAQPLPMAHKQSQEMLMIKAIQPGPADLWIWKSDGSIEHRGIRVDKVAVDPVDPLAPGLSRALERLSEVEIYYSGTGVVLRGTIQTLSEAARIDALLQGFPKDVHDETEPSEDLLKGAQAHLDSWLKTSPYSTRLSVTREDNVLRVDLVQGSIESPAERARIEKRTHAIYPLVQTELASLPDTSPTVHFKVFLLELKKTRFGSIGLGWPAFQEGAFRVTTSGIQDMLQLDLTLQMLEGDGSLKILSNPELVVRAPGDAELFSGGEIPIESQSAYYSNITWKNFGLLLQLHVTQSAGERVRLDITTEVSHLDESLAIKKIPGLQANRMKTQVDAQYGRPLLLSGLLQQGTRKEARGLPLLRSIPILGLLFGSEDYLNEKSELVAILVPSKELPRNPMERIIRFMPRGPIPPSRMPAKLDQERALQQSPDFPWNVLE